MTSTNPTPNPIDIEITPQPTIDIHDDQNYIITTLTRPMPDINNKINELPKPIIKMFNDIAHTQAITYSKIENLNNELADLERHKINETLPEFLTKQYKNIFKNDLETKALLMEHKITQLMTSKSLKLIELIKIFNNRTPDTLSQTLEARNTFQFPRNDIFWTTLLDYYIANQLTEFRNKQNKDKLKKDAKKEKLTKKQELDNIPVVLNTKDFKKLQDKIVNLEKKLTSNKKPNKKKTSNKKTTSKPNSNQDNKNKKHFKKGRKPKSPTSSSRNNPRK